MIIGEQDAHGPAAHAHAHFLTEGNAAKRHPGHALSASNMAVVHGFGNRGPEDGRLQVNDNTNQEVEDESQHDVAGFDRKIENHAEHGGGDLAPAKELDLAEPFRDPGGNHHRENGGDHAGGEEV